MAPSSLQAQQPDFEDPDDFDLIGRKQRSSAQTPVLQGGLLFDDEPSNVCSKSRSNGPYPLFLNTQDDRMGVSRAGRSSTNAPGQTGGPGIIQPAESSRALTVEHVPFDETSAYIHSNSSGWAITHLPLYSEPSISTTPAPAPGIHAPTSPRPSNSSAPRRSPRQRSPLSDAAHVPLGRCKIPTPSHDTTAWIQCPNPTIRNLPPLRAIFPQVSTAPLQQGSFPDNPLYLRRQAPPIHPLIVPSSTSHGGTTSFFSGASDFRMRDILYFGGPQNITVRGARDEPIDGWKLLREHAAPNALHDSSVRYDAPKCDEDTRVEVIRELTEFIEDRDNPQRLLCMTGAAGSGKSALQQTVAERYGNSDTLLSAFFFGAGDSTRNTISPIVPTIAFQMGSRNVALKDAIRAVVAEDPFIFDRSLQTQMDTLIVCPFRCLRKYAILDTTTFPYVILIDGLDECKGEARQAELLTVIRLCLLADDLPFRIFIASRPEMAIRTALEPGGHLHSVANHLLLSDKYYASKDMCRYLRKRFQSLSHRVGDPQWFTEMDINALVGAASGQFIYVASAFNYISEPRSSPADRLKIVLTWTPHEGQVARPFEAVDRLYTNILLNAKEAYEAVDTHHGHDLVVLFRIYRMYPLLGLPPDRTKYTPALLGSLLGLESNALENLVSDLRSLVTVRGGSLTLYPYHKCFYDFLDEESRAKNLFVPQGRTYAHLAKCAMQRIIEYPLEPCSREWKELRLSDSCKKVLWKAFTDLGSFLIYAAIVYHENIGPEIVEFTRKGGWERVNTLLPLVHWKELITPSRRDSCSSLSLDLARVAGVLKQHEPETA